MREKAKKDREQKELEMKMRNGQIENEKNIEQQKILLLLVNKKKTKKIKKRQMIIFKKQQKKINVLDMKDMYINIPKLRKK